MPRNDHKMIYFCFYLFAVTLEMNRIGTFLVKVLFHQGTIELSRQKNNVNSFIALKFKLFSRQSIRMSDAN